jgi:hypothetical protein
VNIRERNEAMMERSSLSTMLRLALIFAFASAAIPANARPLPPRGAGYQVRRNHIRQRPN